ncbi:MAG: DUF5683 domain-containing protein [Flavobacteriales bacterium]|nr:DUF5683 domain-containing protein [Flavobacteriales bacterium]
MKKSLHIFLISGVFSLFGILCTFHSASAQTEPDSTQIKTGGKIKISSSDSASVIAVADSANTSKSKKPKPDFRYHSPVKATWMSAVLPSLGQFYNRRYWKPPIIYVGLGVSLYFLIDNQQKFIIARNSYRARVGVSGFTVHPKYETYSADQILSDRDFYRTNRDYSIIGVGLVYALNIVDAAVDAHLRTFDVSDDLSMKIRPALQWTANNTNTWGSPNTGIKVALTF